MTQLLPLCKHTETTTGRPSILHRNYILDEQFYTVHAQNYWERLIILQVVDQVEKAKQRESPNLKSIFVLYNKKNVKTVEVMMKIFKFKIEMNQTRRTVI